MFAIKTTIYSYVYVCEWGVKHSKQQQTTTTKRMAYKIPKRKMFKKEFMSQIKWIIFHNLHNIINVISSKAYKYAILPHCLFNKNLQYTKKKRKNIITISHKIPNGRWLKIFRNSFSVVFRFIIHFFLRYSTFIEMKKSLSNELL